MLFLERIEIYHVVHLVGANGDKEEVSFLSSSGAELAIFDVLEEVAFASILVVLVENFIFWVHIHLELHFHFIVIRSKIL